MLDVTSPGASEQPWRPPEPRSRLMAKRDLPPPHIVPESRGAPARIDSTSLSLAAFGADRQLIRGTARREHSRARNGSYRRRPTPPHAPDVLTGLYNRLDKARTSRRRSRGGVAGHPAGARRHHRRDVTSPSQVIIRTRKKDIVPVAVQHAHGMPARDDRSSRSGGGTARPTSRRRRWRSRSAASTG